MSSDKQRPGKRAKRLLSEEDRALWSHVVRDVAPLPRSGRRVPSHQADSMPGPVPVPKPPVSGAALPRKVSSPDPKPPPPPSDGARPSGGLAKFERKRARKVAAGRIAIDARLDLHGMRQADAHDALLSFLERAVARGCRTVLVITGKGGSGEAAREVGLEARGVLRRNVPRWLAEPAMARHVVSYTEAHLRHGGAGALYIHLRSVGQVPARNL